jgi:hypothetical protein
MKKVNIFLDDIRSPRMSHYEGKGLGLNIKDIEWVIIKDYFEFVDYVKSNFKDINLISFDHDLACFVSDKEFTGKDAANFLIDYCIDNNESFPNWYVHSDNTTGKKNIISNILNYLKIVEGKDISNFRYYHNGILNNRPV